MDGMNVEHEKTKGQIVTALRHAFGYMAVGQTDEARKEAQVADTLLTHLAALEQASQK